MYESATKMSLPAVPRSLRAGAEGAPGSVAVGGQHKKASSNLTPSASAKAHKLSSILPFSLLSSDLSLKDRASQMFGYTTFKASPASSSSSANSSSSASATSTTCKMVTVRLAQSSR